jgi:CheY-like chemotaxis protein
LDFSKLECGKFTIENEPFRLRDTIDETVKSLSARASEKGLQLACEVAEQVPDQVVGDAIRLRQILTNLIGNAIKFTERGEVVVSIESSSLSPRGYHIRFSVRDTGIGISSDDQRRILEPFTQVDAAPTRRYGGTGLGLSICSELLHLMNSRLSVESRPGEGSRFLFELLLDRPSGSETRSRDSTPPDRSRNMPILVVDHNETQKNVSRAASVSLSVLLVEDTPANQKVVTSVLSKRGHAVTIAHNGREAVELFRKHTFDVVLMDIQMPIMDGFQATAAIREQVANRDEMTPIVAMTAHAMRGDREKCLEAGMNAYIAKPIDVHQLIELVESFTVEAHNNPSAAEKHSDDGLRDTHKVGVIDLEGTIQRLAGDTDLFREFITYFDEDSPKLLDSLRVAITKNDATAVQRAAHSLKGLAANFGAEACVTAAQKLEVAGQTSELKDAASLLSRLEQEVARLAEALAEHRKWKSS